MYLKVCESGDLSLEDYDDFTRFSISTDKPENLNDATSGAFNDLAQDAGEGHYWLDADAVARLSPRSDDPAWQAAFWDMLSKAERFGYYDPDGRKLKAHVA